jgi:hypothetical protein
MVMKRRSGICVTSAATTAERPTMRLSETGKRRRLRHRCFRRSLLRDRRDEAIASAGNGDDIAIAALAVTEGAAQRGHMDAKIAFLDEDVGPHAANQFLLADDRAGLVDKDRENVERACADAERLFAVEQ